MLQSDVLEGISSWVEC